MSFVGTYTPPTRTGSLAATLPGVVITEFAGTYDGPTAPIDGSFAVTLPKVAAAFVGSYTPAVLAAGELAAALPRFVAALSGTYAGPVVTDTTNAAGGRIREGVGVMTLTPPVAPVPPGLDYGHRVDKAVALPTPTLVNGRPT